MTIAELITAFGPSALPAVALLLGIKMILQFSKEQQAQERKSHKEEIEDILEAHKQTSKAQVTALLGIKDSTDDLKLKIQELVEDR